MQIFPLRDLYNQVYHIGSVWLSKVLQLQAFLPKGPPPSFSLGHVALAILEIDNRFIARKQLALNLGLGEGAVRTLIDRLKRAQMLSTFASGCRLSELGIQVYDDINDKLGPFEPPSIQLWGKHSFGLRMKRIASEIGNGLELRDTAVRFGAVGAIILVYLNGRLQMPGLSDLTNEHPDQARTIISTVRLHDKDVILVTWAEKTHTAKLSALSTAINLAKKHAMIS